MTDPAMLVRILNYHNLVVVARDGKLSVSPKDRITPDLRSFIQNHKDPLLAYAIEQGKRGRDVVEQAFLDQRSSRNE